VGKQINIIFPDGELAAELNDSPTAVAIAEALPIESTANRWGEEVYFTIPVRLAESADARTEMQVGELGYWPAGAAFCIFFGPTPVSEGSEPRAYSNVNPFGRITTDIQTMKAVLSAVKDGDPVRVTYSNGNV